MTQEIEKEALHLDQPYCPCLGCIEEIQALSATILDIQMLPGFIKRDKNWNKDKFVDLTNVTSLRDILLILKPLVHELNETLRTIEPLES